MPAADKVWWHFIKNATQQDCFAFLCETYSLKWKPLYCTCSGILLHLFLAVLGGFDALGFFWGCCFCYINKTIWMPGKASSTAYVLAVDELQYVKEWSPVSVFYIIYFTSKHQQDVNYFENACYNTCVSALTLTITSVPGTALPVPVWRWLCSLMRFGTLFLVCHKGGNYLLSLSKEV